MGETGSEDAIGFLLAECDAKQLAQADPVLAGFFIREPALRAAARIGGPKALAAAKAHAWSPPYDTYWNFALMTRYFVPKEVVPVLIEFLGHPKVYQRQQAFYSLLRVGKPAVESLIVLLGDKKASPVARQWAVWTLGWMDDERVIAPLTEALNDKLPGIRAKAAWAMGRNRIDDSAKRLNELTKDSDPAVREYATEALSRLRVAD